jgi:transposase
VSFGGLLADKAFDTNAIIAELRQRGADVVDSQHPRRAQPIDIDLNVYKECHLVENFFGKLKKFKRLATRSDKTDTSFSVMVYLRSTLFNAC